MLKKCFPWYTWDMIRFRYISALFLVFSLLASCKNQNIQFPRVQKIVSIIPEKLPERIISLIPGRAKTPQDPDNQDRSLAGQSEHATVHLAQNDEDLAIIAEDARDTLPLFFVTYSAREPVKAVFV